MAQMGNRTPQCVLVTRFSALGDVAMTLPVIYGVCAANPAIRFVMLTRPLPARMFVNAPANLTVVPVDLDQYKGLGGMRRLLKETVAEYGIDALADLHDVLRTKMLRLWARLRGLKVAAVDKDRAGRRRLTKRGHAGAPPLRPMPERYRDVFARLGLKTADSFGGLFAAGRGDAAMFASVTPPPAPGEQWIAVAPFAAHRGKIYPLDKMREVVALLAARPGSRIFIFGAGEREALMIDSLAQGLPNVTSMARHRIGLAGELALMSRCAVMIAMDSANMHLASLAGIPVVSVWGATHPAAGFSGFGQDPALAVQLDLPCRPCSVYGSKPCRFGDWRCLAISPATVAAKAAQVLDRAQNTNNRQD